MRPPPFLPQRSVPELEHHIEQLLIAPVSNRAGYQPRRLIRRPHVSETLDDRPGTDAPLSLDITGRHCRPPGHRRNPPQFRNQAHRVISPEKVDFVRHDLPGKAYAQEVRRNAHAGAISQKINGIFFANRQYSKEKGPFLPADARGKGPLFAFSVYAFRVRRAAINARRIPPIPIASVPGSGAAEIPVTSRTAVPVTKRSSFTLKKMWLELKATSAALPRFELPSYVTPVIVGAFAFRSVTRRPCWYGLPVKTVPSFVFVMLIVVSSTTSLKIPK